jgi:sporulation protein YlmC with PRC-barrel domain
VRYAVLAFDQGILSGDRLFAVPTTELKWGANKNEVVYDMRREQLEKAGVEKSRWSDASRDREYLASLDRIYGIVQPSQHSRAFRASELLGKDVNARQGEDVGEIRDLVIDMNAQRVHYAVLSFDPGWTAPEKLYAFPLRAFRFTDDKDELALDIDKSRLQAMRSFDQKLWTTYTTPVFVTDIDRYLVTVTPIKESSAASSSSPASMSRTASPVSPVNASGVQRTATADAAKQGGSVVTTSPEYTAAMKRLQESAQKLRESIQAMAQHPSGERRNQAIREARQALSDTNQAMTQLPPELRSKTDSSATGATGSTAPGGARGSTGTASAMSEAEYSRSMQQLQKSAGMLRESIQSMAQQTPGQRRDQAIAQAHQALHDVNEAMAQLPPELRTKN